MSYLTLGRKCGVTSDAIQRLLRGDPSISIASKLGVASSSIKTAMSGGQSISFAQRVGVTSDTIQQLHRDGGPTAIAGLVIGMLIEANRN